MKHDIVGLYFSELPVIICTKNSFVAEANPAATAKLCHIAEGEFLFTYMSPYDRLCYEAAYDSLGKTSAITFSIDGYHGFHYGAAVFERLMGRRFSAVALFKSESGFLKSRGIIEKEEDNSISPAKVSDFLTSFSRLDANVFDGEDYSQLFDLKAVTARALSDMTGKCSMIDCDFAYSENTEMEGTLCMPSSIGIGSYLKMLLTMAYVMNDITSNRKILVRLCRYGDDTELRLSTDTDRLPEYAGSLDGLIDVLPQCSVRLAACNYIAGCSGCILGVAQADDCSSLTLTLLISGDMPEAIDFKSRDQFRYYDERFQTAAEYILKLD